MQHLLLITAIIASLGETTAASLYHRSSRVQTTSGIIVGHKASNKTDVTEFLGIRYAQAPVGELRFAAPVSYVAPEGTIFEASEWSPDCPSNKPLVSNFPNFTTPSGLRVWKNFAAQNNNTVSEDCLKLNIWRKDSGGYEAKKPVLVFIHGGRFQIPGPHSPYYNGQYLADHEDIIVVTINYRLGIFGFPGSPALPANPSLLDHRSAIHWLHTNIASFGGDPSRIVISGQSAGGASVDYWSFAWSTSPLVSGLISMSGTSLSFLPNTPQYAQSLWYNVSQTLGCGGPTDPPASVLSCVRSKESSAILSAAAKVPTLPSQATTQATFHPTIDNTTVFADYASLSAAGAFAKIPLLLGSTDTEHGWYKLSAFAANRNLTAHQWALFTQRAFTCPAAHTARDRVQHGVPTWRYRYLGDWANLRLYNGAAGLGGSGSGAYHGSDLSMVFGTARDVSGLRNEVEEDGMAGYMMRVWGKFVRNPRAGLRGLGWPEYAVNGSTLVGLGFNGSGTMGLVEPGVYDGDCPEVNDPLPGRGAF